MVCPNCQSVLSISSREGVEIDFCPQCRGVWLDRGELDKIIERAAVEIGGRDDRPRPQERLRDDDRSRDVQYQGDDRSRDDRYRDDDRYRGDRSHGKRKRRSFLDDLFDD